MKHTSRTRTRSSVIQFKHFFVVGLVGLLGCSNAASAATIAVSNEAELRAAIATATSDDAQDTIDLGGSTIVLRGDELEVSVPSSGNLIFNNGTIDGSNVSRIFNFSEASANARANRVIFDFITLKKGAYITADGPATEQGGAAIFSNGVNISLADSFIEDNTVIGSGTGGAVFVRNAEIEVTRTEFRNNRAIANGANNETSGGAIGTNSSDFINIEDSLFVNNFASRGGAIAPINHSGVMFIESSTFSNNQASDVGGAIWNRHNLVIETSTFFQNTAGAGGGALYLQPLGSLETASVRRSTFVDNSSASRANTIFLASTNPLPKVQGNIFVDNNGAQNCGVINSGTNPATFADDGFNFSDDSSCGTASPTGDTSAFFVTGSPTNNGGLTPTIALSGESLAVDAGIPLGEVSCELNTTDQRGEPVVNACDAGSYELQPIVTDGDNDGFPDSEDNCPAVPNEGQEDFNGNDIGDACDDSDGDGTVDATDNCPTNVNSGQEDFDNDRQGDECDDDDDNDQVLDVDDDLPFNAAESVDTDQDGTGNNADLDDDNDGQLDTDELACESDPLDNDSTSADADDDGIPDCVDNDFTLDADGDTVPDANDNCPVDSNANQSDFDRDGQGDVCDLDDDNDGTPDLEDAFPLDASEQTDTDNDGVGNNGDLDDDNDGQTDADELECGSDPLDNTSKSPDVDDDGIPDCVDTVNDTDTDGDGFPDAVDNCPADANPLQENSDGDRQGNVCDLDDDNDGTPDLEDAFPLDSSEQTDTDNDGVGNNADVDDDNDGQSDVHEAACGSDPLNAASNSPDADGDNIPNCVDDDFVVNTGPVTVYRDVNFLGSSLSVGMGEVSIAELRNSPVGNDRISSIEIDPGYEVLACQNSGFRGRCETFTSNTPDLRSISFNDKISSLEVRLATTSPVTIYRDVNFKGASLGIDLGEVSIGDLRNSVIGNDTISSIGIASGYEVVACSNSRMRGRCETFTNDVSDLRTIQFNDVISSLEVRLVSAASPATLFQHVNFRGASLDVQEGEVSIGELRNSPVGNDRISSIRIAPGFSVVACSNSRMRGRCVTFFNDTSDLRTIQFNDVISSLEVRSN